MVVGFLKKLLGGGQTAPGTATVTNEGNPDIETFVAYIVRSLVDNPDGVTVDMVAGEDSTTIRVRCEKPDVGKVIGKNGKTIAAIRALVNGAGGRIGKRVNVEILD